MTNDSANDVSAQQRDLATARRYTISPGRTREMPGLATTETEVVYTVFDSAGAEIGCVYLSVPPDKVGEADRLLVSSARACPE